MKTTHIEQQLHFLIQQLLIESGTDHPHRTFSLDSSLQRHLGIDSLGRAELFQRIEKQFNVRLPDQVMMEADTVSDLVQAISNASSSPSNDFRIKESQTPIPPAEDLIWQAKDAKTLIDVLLLYATKNPDRAHIHLQNEQGGVTVITYGLLLSQSLRVAQALLDRGLTPGSTVAIMQPTNPGFFYTFFGALMAKCIPVPIYPPFRPHQLMTYAKQEANILKNAEARILVTFQEAEQLSKLLRAFVPSLKEVTTVHHLLQTQKQASIPALDSQDFALIQYTSGSTSLPKGVLLSHANLLANIRAYGDAIRATAFDVTVSWAPLYHDLGLIGMWFGSLYYGFPLALLSPLTFLNRPERWLWTIHHYRGTLSGGPNFAYELCIRKIDPSLLEGLDLSSWRIAANGAEPIQPSTLKRFTEKFAPYGFRHETHVPMYGLAESAVCVAVSPLNRAPRIDKIERKAFEEKGQALPSQEEGALEFVACGKAIPNHFIRIVDENNHILPERRVGKVQFSGPSSMQGYYGNPEATLAVYHEGWWDTGDLGYLSNKEIFITGRQKDVIIKAGRNLYPAEIEQLTAEIEGIRKGCVIAFGVIDPNRGTEKLVLVAETILKNPPNADDLHESIAAHILEALDIAPDHIVLVPPQTIPKTSSGKLQRAAGKAAYLSGKLQAHRTPIWWQFTRLGLSSFAVILKKGIFQSAKFLYSLYVGSVLGITLLPILFCLRYCSRDQSARICRYWARSLFLLAGCPLRVHNAHHLTSKYPVIYAANHQSYIDALIFLAVLPEDTRIVGKQELRTTPMLRFFMQKLDYLAVDRTNVTQGIEDTRSMEKTLRQNHAIGIFPEGTFTYAVGLRPFKTGGFKIAADTHTPVCPIAISGSRHILRGEERLLRPGRVDVFVSTPILPKGSTWQEVTQLKNQVRATILKNCGEPSLDFIHPQLEEKA